MPDILAAPRPWADGIAHRCCGKFRQVELHDHRRDLSRVHADGFLPPEFVGIGWSRRSTVAPCIWITRERLPLNQLHVRKVEMDGVRVAGEIHDLPHFRGSGIGIFGARRHVRLSPSRQALVVHSILGKSSNHLNQAAHLVEVLIQRQHSISAPMKRERWSGWIAVVEQQARLIASQEVTSQLHVHV